MCTDWGGIRLSSSVSSVNLSVSTCETRKRIPTWWHWVTINDKLRTRHKARPQTGNPKNVSCPSVSHAVTHVVFENSTLFRPPVNTGFI